jgi:hypothetical protein
MDIKETEKTILRFIRNVKVYWQIIFLITILAYGISFIYRLDAQTSPKSLKYLGTLNWLSFALALILAITILQFKRRYLSLKFFRKYLEQLSSDKPEFQSQELVKNLLHYTRQKLKTVWHLGAALILLGVAYYWWTFDAWNMHVYFVVGLYSLMINYPRRELFIDIPYLVEESIKRREATQ